VAIDVGDHRVGGVLVLLALGQLEQFGGLGQPVEHVGDAADGLLQQGALASQGLCALGIVPDVGQFQFAVYFFKTLFLGVVVKDTPEAKPPDR